MQNPTVPRITRGDVRGDRFGTAKPQWNGYDLCVYLETYTTMNTTAYCSIAPTAWESILRQTDSSDPSIPRNHQSHSIPYFMSPLQANIRRLIDHSRLAYIERIKVSNSILVLII